MTAPTNGAIPTTYNGVTFRSRLEARWARLLDLLEIEWKYEPEGYEWDSIRYLPDFWLPTGETFLEIKPAYDLFPRQMILAAATDKRVVVGVGDVEHLRCVEFRPWQENGYLRISRFEGLLAYCKPCRKAWWSTHAEHRFCALCGSLVDLSDTARKAQNEQFWNPVTPPIKTTPNVTPPSETVKESSTPTTSLKDRLRSARGTDLQVIPTCPFTVGMRVFHETFGEGDVVSIASRGNGDAEITVDFFTDGGRSQKSMLASIVIDKMVPA